MRGIPSLIIENFNLWTSSSVESGPLRGRRSSSSGRIYGVDKLRALIIHLGVQGKLVPQLSDEESATKLLEKIKTKKVEMLGDNKIRKSKIPLNASVDSLEFQLPKGWAATSIGEVIDFINGYAFSSKDFSPKGTGIVKIGDIQNGSVDVSNLSYVPESVVSSLSESLKVVKGDLLIAMSGATTGKLGFNNTDEVLYLNQRVGKINPILCSKKFLYYFLTTKITENLKKSYGSAIPNLSTEQIKSIPFGMPPLSEQYRITKKIEEYLALCDSLEEKTILSDHSRSNLSQCIVSALIEAKTSGEFRKCWARMSELFDVLFVSETDVEKLRKSILTLAMMGKLVDQDVGDESVLELLKAIKSEKNKISAEGNIKKIKSFTPIDSVEKPFKLPNGWAWIRLNEITSYIQRGISPEYVEKSQYPVVSQKCVRWGGLDLEPARFINPVTIEKYDSIRFLQPGDLLWNSTGTGTIGRACLVELESPEQILVADSHVTIVRPVGVINKFLFRWIESSFVQNEIEKMASGTTNQIELNTSVVQSLLIPLPPLREQMRIVKKIDELMFLCEQLGSGISNANELQKKISDVLIEQAIT